MEISCRFVFVTEINKSIDVLIVVPQHHRSAVGGPATPVE